MSEETLKSDNIRVNKKEFHKTKQPINLDLVNLRIAMMVLNILLVKKKVRLLNRYALSYLK